MSERDALLQARKAAYAAGLDEAQWPSALAALTPLFGATGATFEVVNKPDLAMLDFWSHGFPSGADLAYADQYLPLNPRMTRGLSLGAGRPGGIAYDGLILDETQMNRDPFYAEFLGGAGLRYFISAMLEQTADRYAVIAVQRSARQGHVGEREIALMRELVPHLQQAFDMTARLRRAERKSRAFEQALDWLVDGAALIYSDRRILYANRALQRIAQRDDGIRIVKGRLEFVAKEVHARYEEAIAAAQRVRARQHKVESQSDFPVPRPSGAPPYLLSVRPLIPGSYEHKLDGRAHALVFVRDPMRPHVSSISLLRDLFGLTEAEASVAVALQTGTPLVDYARSHGLSPNTVYTHARRIREKTQTSRLAELIQRLKDVEIPVRSD